MTAKKIRANPHPNATRYTQADVDAFRADYEVGNYSLPQLAKQYGISTATVYKWRDNGWQVKTQVKNLKARKSMLYVEAVKLAQEVDSYNLTPAEREAFERGALDDANFILQSDQDFQKVRDVAINDLLPDIKTPGELKQLADVLKAVRETRNKMPDVALQINNAPPQRIERVIIDADDLDD